MPYQVAMGDLGDSKPMSVHPSLARLSGRLVMWLPPQISRAAVFYLQPEILFVLGSLGQDVNVVAPPGVHFQRPLYRSYVLEGTSAQRSQLIALCISQCAFVFTFTQLLAVMPGTRPTGGLKTVAFVNGAWSLDLDRATRAEMQVLVLSQARAIPPSSRMTSVFADRI